MEAIIPLATCLLAASLNYSTTLKMEAIRSSETSGTTQRTTWRHIPEEDTLQIQSGLTRVAGILAGVQLPCLDLYPHTKIEALGQQPGRSSHLPWSPTAGHMTLLKYCALFTQFGMHSRYGARNTCFTFESAVWKVRSPTNLESSPLHRKHTSYTIQHHTSSWTFTSLHWATSQFSMTCEHCTRRLTPNHLESLPRSMTRTISVTSWLNHWINFWQSDVKSESTLQHHNSLHWHSSYPQAFSAFPSASHIAQRPPQTTNYDATQN
jgi:hypothetical protein